MFYWPNFRNFVVFWGAALVLFLLRWIKFSNDDLRGFWIEAASQIENGMQSLKLELLRFNSWIRSIYSDKYWPYTVPCL